MDLLATSMHADIRPTVVQMTNTEQRDAFRYGSAFSRGAYIRERNLSFIEVSGTAAIDRSGMSLYQDDIQSQISCTFDKIEALLSQKDANLYDICAATVFVKHPEHAAIFRKMIRARGLNDFPCVCVVADICRDELLFEIDAEVTFEHYQMPCSTTQGQFLASNQVA
jgi:enamine deaminase RidA (YjgF/YER057c/UK114 family)